jgi:hypothetical protein
MFGMITRLHPKTDAEILSNTPLIGAMAANIHHKAITNLAFGQVRLMNGVDLGFIA